MVQDNPIIEGERVFYTFRGVEFIFDLASWNLFRFQFQGDSYRLWVSGRGDLFRQHKKTKVVVTFARWYLAKMSGLLLQRLPENLHTHHGDENKQNNCLYNLMFLPRGMHFQIHRDFRRKKIIERLLLKLRKWSRERFTEKLLKCEPSKEIYETFVEKVDNHFETLLGEMRVLDIDWNKIRVRMV